jgi:hypothetical protein
MVKTEGENTTELEGPESIVLILYDAGWAPEEVWTI